MPNLHDEIVSLVKKKPFLVIQFSEAEWEALEESPKGISEFTIARKHDAFHNVSEHRFCLLLGDRGREGIYVGIFANKTRISTLETRVKIKNVKRIQPRTKVDLFGLLATDKLTSQIESRLEGELIKALTPGQSERLAQRLLEINFNKSIIEELFNALSRNRKFSNAKSLQEDALNMVLKAFGRRRTPKVDKVFISSEETALDSIVHIVEDSVIEHDARSIPGYELIQSFVTGRAIFKSGDGRRLEVFTANRRRLEKVLGVDLIYVNKIRGNVIMVQYKMLEAVRDKDDRIIDWNYRHNEQLTKEILRMKTFTGKTLPSEFEYRLNSDAFYMKFVKRDGSLEDTAMIIPLNHYETIKQKPNAQGQTSTISYNGLDGLYLRPSGFIELMKTGYIGSYSTLGDNFQDLINLVLDGDKSIVAAIEESDEFPFDEPSADGESNSNIDDSSYDDLPF